MSEENVELLRGYYGEIFDAHGLDRAVKEFWHPEIELLEGPGVPGADRYVGADAVRERAESYREVGWDGHFRDPEFLDAGEEIVFVWEMRGRSAHGGGIPLELTIAHVVLVDEDGKMRRIKQFLSREEALEAAGLSE